VGQTKLERQLGQVGPSLKVSIRNNNLQALN